jgi:hypothetical protein
LPEYFSLFSDLLFFAVLLLTDVAGGVFVLYWWFAMRARKAARLEMKRHIQRIGGFRKT